MNELPRLSSPHLHQSRHDTGWLMFQVVVAALPGVAALVLFFGWGVIVNILLGAAIAALCESAAVLLRRRAPLFYLRDCSALVTALLLGIALPPHAPWWVVIAANATAILFGKHVYGGLGYNPFNPAMVGYVVALISFPVPMTTWAAPLGALAGHTPAGPIDALLLCLRGTDGNGVDALSMATPLDLLRSNTALTMSELRENYRQFGSFAGRGWEWANIGFLLGGGYLLWRRIYTWHAPVGMLGALILLSALFYSADSGSHGSPLFHLLSGATMLGAFFIVTDPVSGSVSNRGRLIFGIGVGVLLFFMRAFSNYPDAVAFAVLLMNFTAPLIDHYIQPRTYGYTR